MKKKVRKYAEGGEPKFERGTYERARAMLLDQGPDRTPSLDARIARAREMIEGVRQSASEPAPSRFASRPAPAAAPRPAGNAETIDASSGRGMRRTAMEQAQEQEDADMGRARQSAAVRSRIIPSAPTAADRNDADEGANLRRAMQRPDAAARQTIDRIAERAQDKYRELEAEARGRESDTRERERQAQEERDSRKAAARLRDEVKGQAKQDMLEREMPKPSRIPQNTMGVRAAQQMEEKGSIYSPDYGLSRAEREAKKEREERERVAKREAEARGRQSDTRERERQAQEERDRRKAAERIRETTRAEVRNSRSATPPVPPPGTRAFANRRRRDLAGPAMTGSPGFKSGGKVSSASKRADGIAKKGKTRGKVC